MGAQELRKAWAAGKQKPGDIQKRRELPGHVVAQTVEN